MISFYSCHSKIVGHFCHFLVCFEAVLHMTAADFSFIGLGGKTCRLATSWMSLFFLLFLLPEKNGVALALKNTTTTTSQLYAQRNLLGKEKGRPMYCMHVLIPFSLFSPHFFNWLILAAWRMVCITLAWVIRKSAHGYTRFEFEAFCV